MLYNPNNLSIQVTARLLSPQGLPLAVSVNGVTASTMNTVLTPQGSLNLRLEDVGDVKAGWCQVFSSWPISGLVIYQTVEGGKVISEATVYPSPRWKKTAVVAPQLGTNSDIGIAIANPWEYPVTGSMRLINSAGVVITTSNFSLGAGQQSAKFISQYFQGLTSIPEGVVEISSSQSLVAVGLLFQFQSAIQGNNVFTTIPILPLP